MEFENQTMKVEEFTAEAQKTMEENVEKMTQNMEDVAEFNRQNMEAFVAASKRAAKVAEEMNAEFAAFAKKSYEDGIAAFKDMQNVQSVNELFEKQSQVAKTSFDTFVAQATKMNEMVSGATKECFEPFQARLQAAADMVKQARA